MNVARCTDCNAIIDPDDDFDEDHDDPALCTLCNLTQREDRDDD